MALLEDCIMSSLRSFSITSIPLFTETSVIPPPINPAPKTAMRSVFFGLDLYGFFFFSVVVKNRFLNALETSDNINSSKRTTSFSYPFLSPFFKPASTQSIMAIGAG